ncbi:Endonuclease/exonuclease/phosphatase, partial [Trema orientale]
MLTLFAHLMLKQRSWAEELEDIENQDHMNKDEMTASPSTVIENVAIIVETFPLDQGNENVFKGPQEEHTKDHSQGKDSSSFQEFTNDSFNTSDLSPTKVFASKDESWQEVIASHLQHVSASFKLHGELFFASFVYASCNYMDSRYLWDSLSSLHVDGPWLVMGDFNSIMGAHETTGILKRQSCEEFRAGVTLFNLTDLDTQGPLYNWRGVRRGKIIMSCPDRAFCNEGFLDQWQQLSCLCLPRNHSDHHPLLISLSKVISNGPRPFRFQGMWLSHPIFKDLVSKVWTQHLPGLQPMPLLFKKLKELKKELKVWNWQVFDDLRLNISKANDRVLSVQERLANESLYDSLLFQEIEALNSLDSLLLQEKTYFREQSRIKWLKEGDRNSVFFHNMVKR